jgi:DeoR/GlpR family transcriptional regulator of sugar metabolism
MMGALYLDKLFLGGVGIDAQRGITTIEYDEAETFRAMAAQARTIVAVMDSSKIGVVRPALVAPIGQIKTLITGVEATPRQIAPFVAAGIEVIQA